MGARQCFASASRYLCNGTAKSRSGDATESTKMKLKDRVVLITGGGSGIGRAIALKFASEGAQIIVAGRTPSKLQTTVAALEAEQARCAAVDADVSNSAAVRKIFAYIEGEYGGSTCLLTTLALASKISSNTTERLRRAGKRCRPASRFGPSGV